MSRRPHVFPSDQHRPHGLLHQLPFVHHVVISDANDEVPAPHKRQIAGAVAEKRTLVSFASIGFDDEPIPENQVDATDAAEGNL